MKTLKIVSLLIVVLFSCSNQSNYKTKKGINNTNKLEQIIKTSNSQISDTIFSFDNEKSGEMPYLWSNYFTGKGKLGKWSILNDNGNKILAQTSKDNSGYHFDVIVNNELSYKNLEISVKFKGVEGNEDQGGGPVWRYQDADNYYIARANPLENNFRVYKIVKGNRKQLKSINLKINTGQWYSIKITMTGNKINCYFDGELKLETNDNSLPNAGKVGLWTKADAVTYFDNFSIKQLGD